MRYMEISKQQLQLSEDVPCTIVYYVTIDEFTDGVTGIQLEAYGVGITICERSESVSIPNVTFSKTAILRLSALLCEHLVTPATIHDVVEDWLVS